MQWPQFNPLQGTEIPQPHGMPPLPLPNNSNTDEETEAQRICDLPGEGNGNPLQYSCLGNPMDRGAWWATRGDHFCLFLPPCSLTNSGPDTERNKGNSGDVAKFNFLTVVMTS